MRKKYIIEIEDDRNIIEMCILNGKCTLSISTQLDNSEGFTNISIPVIPYTAPDLDAIRKEEYNKGFQAGSANTSLVITDNTIRERIEEAYQQGLEDARNRKATCEFCEYAGNDESNEPCVSCCCGYMNRFIPKREPKQIEFGDELRSKNNPNIRVCVTNVRGSKWDGIAISEVIDSCRFGSSYTDRNLNGWEKTGRNFASALQDMMNEKF